MKKLQRIAIVALLMLGGLTACGGGTSDGSVGGGGDGNGLDANGEVQGVPGTVSPMDQATTTP